MLRHEAERADLTVWARLDVDVDHRAKTDCHAIA
jgi:hypothetical protein